MPVGSVKFRVAMMLACAVGALSGAMADRAASATSRSEDGSNPDLAAIGETVVDMLDRLRACAAEAGRPSVAIALKLPETLPLERDQNINLLDVLDSMLTEKVKDTGEIPDLDYVKLYSAQKQADEETSKAYTEKADILVEPEVKVLGKNPMVHLMVIRTRIAGCDKFLSSRDVVIPQAILGEPFLEPSQLVSRFADTFVADDVRGREHRLYLLPEAASKMRGLADQAVAELPKNIAKKNKECLCAPTTISVEEPTEVPGPSSEKVLNWSFDLKRISDEIRGADAVKILMVADPREGNPSGARSEGGLVEIDKLPQRVEASSDDLQALPPTVRTGVLKEIPVELLSTKNIETMGERPLVYKFTVDTPSIVEIDLKNPKDQKIEYELLNSAGDLVPPDFRGKLRVNLTRYRLSEGIYFAKISVNSEVTDYSFRFRRSTTQLVSEAPGTLIRQYGDWLVGEQVVEGRKACFAYTSATDESVTNRLQRPILYFALREGTSDPLAHKVDNVSFYDPKFPIGAVIYGRGKEIAKTELYPFSTGELAPMEIKNGEKMSSLQFQRGYTDGSSMLITGRDPRGNDTQVVYSLRGYRFAVNAIAENCNRPDVYHILDFSRGIK
jgi:hypothetical protein